jgi:hypothetical protein
MGGGFWHHSDLLREGDEARVVLVAAQERIGQQLDHTGVVRGPGVLQPFEHLLRLVAQGIDLGNLSAGRNIICLSLAARARPRVSRSADRS